MALFFDILFVVKQGKKLFILFGATGDLSREKLLPALFSLYQKGKLEDMIILAVSRRPYSREEYHQFICRESALAHKPDYARFDLAQENCAQEKNKTATNKDIMCSRSNLEQGVVDNTIGEFEAFLEKIHYISGNFDNEDLFERIQHYTDTYNIATAECDTAAYLAIDPKFYEPIIIGGARAGLWGRDVNSRVLIEKPYAQHETHFRSLKRVLDDTLGDRALLVDHYLGKAPLRDISRFHEQEHELHTLIDRNLERVAVRLFEANNVDKRGSFYDNTGAFMDTGANHALLMLAKALVPHDDIDTFLHHLTLVRAPKKFQYKGYRDTPHVDPHSNTETAFDISLASTDPQWSSVAMRLGGGKGFARYASDVTLHFSDHTQLILELKPQQRIVYEPLGINLSFESAPDAYEVVVMDAYADDPTCFTTSDTGYEEWRINTLVHEAWGNTEPQVYSRGAKVPEYGTTSSWEWS